MQTIAPAIEAPLPDLCRHAVVTIGNYDGIHLGQRQVLERVVGEARRGGHPAMVIGFDPHPLRVLAPERAPALLTTLRQRERLLEEIGIDLLLLLPFTRELAALPAERFVEEILVDRLAVRSVLVGSRFTFGHDRQGDLALLARLGERAGFRATGVPELELEGAPVSATRIRAALAAGRVDEAARLLGRPWALPGRVVAGNGAGRQLGFPTLNLEAELELLPSDGVYVTATRLEGEADPRPGVTNVGRRPTLHREGPRLAETHLLDLQLDLYGREVEVLFLQRLRDEQRFPDRAALVARIAQDVELGREYFRRAGRSQGHERVASPGG